MWPIMNKVGLNKRDAVAVFYKILNRFSSVQSITVTRAIFVLLSLGCFLVVTIFPELKNKNIKEISYSDILRSCYTSWYMILAALYLKYKEPIDKRFQEEQSKGLAWKTRKLTSALAILRLEPKAIKNSTELNQIRNEILSCIASSISESLGLPRHLFCANLLEYKSDLEMEVVARSEVHRSTAPSLHRVTPVFGPWRAIYEGQRIVEDDVKGDPRWNTQTPPYRSILILPITKNSRAFGTITVDCIYPYVFASKSLTLEILLQPYIALLSLTFGQNNQGKECSYTPPRH